ncbi:MAG: CoA transferase, partial [Acidimicrobiales bacterium]|nr:CoA transferase [Acidimicrobiales bacterium]
MADETVRPLQELRVVDLSTGIAGPYCTKLFADAGADVVKVEPPGGDPLRTYVATGPAPDGEDGVLFRYLNAGKRSIIGELGDVRVAELLGSADLVVDDAATEHPAIEAAVVANPRLVSVSITPFGRTGPLAGAPATDLTLQCESGAITFKGDPTRAPVQAGGRVAEYFGGIFAAPPALACALRARSTGRGERIDVAIHDVMAVAGSNYTSVLHDVLGQPPITTIFRGIDTPGIEAASDGLVAFNTNAGHMFQLFLLLVERPDLMDDPTYSSWASRLAMGSEWQDIIDAWVSQNTVADVLDAAAALRVPVAPVHDGATVLEDAHLVDRQAIVTSADGLVHPRPPYRLNGTAMGARTPAPRLGEHHRSLQPWPPRRMPDSAPVASQALPLAGVKVLDLTSWWVGAMATHTLALLGADVIHVEGVAHPDGMRLTGSTFARTEDWWEWGHMFA